MYANVESNPEAAACKQEHTVFMCVPRQGDMCFSMTIRTLKELSFLVRKSWNPDMEMRQEQTFIFRKKNREAEQKYTHKQTQTHIHTFSC